MKSLPAFIRKTIPDFWLRYLGCAVIALFCTTSIFLTDLDRLIINNNHWYAKPLAYAAMVENWFYDLRSSHLYLSKEKVPDIVALVIDDQSLSEIGRWPWSRRKHAKIVERLDVSGARTVLFDILFAEPEALCLAPQAKLTPKDLVPPDKQLSAAMKEFQKSGNRRIILGYSLTSFEEEALETPLDLLSENMISGNLGRDKEMFRGLPFISAFNFPVSELLQSGAGVGFLENIPDIDGVFRHAALVSSVDDFLVPSAGLALFYHYFKQSYEDRLAVEPNEKGIANPFFIRYSSANPGDETLAPMNALGEVRVRYKGGRDSFIRYNVGELLLDDFSDAKIVEKWRTRLKDKAIVIGSEAVGAHDLRHTPVEATMPGMYVHANVFNMFNEKFFFRAQSKSITLSLLALILGCFVVLIVSHLANPFLEIFSVASYVTLFFLIDRYIFLPDGYRPALFFVSAGTLGSYTWVTFLNVLKEIRERIRIRQAFTRYVSKDVVKEVLANPERLKLGGQKRVITMLFSDIRSFTSISERLTPQELTGLLNTYMNRMTEILFSTSGTLDKYIGDALVAFWGAPVDLPNHAYQSVKAGAAMLEALPIINEDFKRRSLPVVEIGIGINTGEVSVGNMGSDQIFAYTALGDHMNLASRLEGLTKHYKSGLILSQYTLKALGDARSQFVFRSLDKVKVKGREETLLIYELLPSYHALYSATEALRLYEEGFNFYQKGAIADALERLSQANALAPNFHTQTLIDRCVALSGKILPEPWDPSFVFTEK